MLNNYKSYIYIVFGALVLFATYLIHVNLKYAPIKIRNDLDDLKKRVERLENGK